MGSLGYREIDKKFDFNKARLLYREEKKKYTSFLQLVKEVAIPKSFPYELHRKPPSPCQKEALKLVKQVVRDTMKKKYKLLILRGGAGVGKSNTWMTSCAYMRQKNVPFIVVSPIASSCADIGGITIHSFIGITNVKTSFENQLAQPFFNKQIKDRIKKTLCVCVDEIYLCGSHVFELMIRRIWKAKTKNPPSKIDVNNLPCSFIVCGDEMQNHSPLDFSLCCPIREDHDSATKTALSIFQNAHYNYELKTNMRQIADKPFQDLLIHIRENKVNDFDISLMETRLEQNLSNTELSRFVHSPHIFCSNFLANRWTEIYLSMQQTPIKRVPVVLEPSCSACESEFPVCFLGEGVKVSITRNICQPANVCNGTRVTVEQLYYERDTDIQPLFVTVKMNPGSGYSGPKLFDGTLPIPRLVDTGYCQHHERRYKVTFFPFRSDSGITHYRCQSQTLSSVVCSFSGFRFRDRALYVMLSRCTSLKNLVITANKPLREYFIEK